MTDESKMIYARAQRITLLKKDSDYNYVQLSIREAVTNTRYGLRFNIYWNKDSPEKLIHELKTDAKIIITNTEECNKLLNIYHKYNPRISYMSNEHLNKN